MFTSHFRQTRVGYYQVGRRKHGRPYTKRGTPDVHETEDNARTGILSYG
jgi:hypothetical protein